MLGSARNLERLLLDFTEQEQHEKSVSLRCSLGCISLYVGALGTAVVILLIKKIAQKLRLSRWYA